jgi:hypothetical protein
MRIPFSHDGNSPLVKLPSGSNSHACRLTGQSLSRAQNISSGVNKLRAREKIGPVNLPLTSQSTCLFNRFAPFFGEVTIGRLTEGKAAA